MILVFTKKKFIKTHGRKSYAWHKEWVDKINGRTKRWVENNTELFISEDWCVRRPHP
jgi:hypothetical protein